MNTTGTVMLFILLIIAIAFAIYFWRMLEEERYDRAKESMEYELEIVKLNEIIVKLEKEEKDVLDSDSWNFSTDN